MFLVAEIGGLDEIDDAPKIEQGVFERRAGEGKPMLRFQLLDGLSDLRARILDELSLVEDDGAEGKFLQLFQIAAEERIVRDDDVVLRNLFAQVMPCGAAFEDEHFEARREPIGFATPVVQDGCGTNDERRGRIFGIAMFEPGKPTESLERFAKSHIVGEDSAEFDLSQMAEEIEAVLLIWTQLGLDDRREINGRNTFEILQLFA